MSLLGDRLRELRMNRSLTLKQVSDETGLSVSFLSLVERDKVSISVDNLEKLARYYGVRLVHLFQGVEDSTVLVTHGSQVPMEIPDGQKPPSELKLLSYRSGARMEPILVHIPPGEGDSDFRTHDGDILLYTVSGCIRLRSEKGETYELTPGDSAYYYGYPGRRIENGSPDEPAVMLMVTVPPTGLRDDALDGRRGVLIQPVGVRPV